MNEENVIELSGVVTRFGETVVHEGVDLAVKRNEVLGIIGGSGSGKSVLLRVMTLLLAPAEGEVRLFGQTVDSARERDTARRRFGVMFQSGGMFSDLTVLENVGFVLKEFTELAPDTIAALARLKLALVGLAPEAGHRAPSALSGGMLKRASIARALALDPELIFLDEPSAGLDPASVQALDELIVTLRDHLGMTVIMISHELPSLRRVTDRVAFLGERKVLALSPIADLSQHEHPLIAAYFEAAANTTGTPS